MSEEASERISFTDFPCHVAKDLMVAFSRNKKGDLDGNNFIISVLRKKMGEKGFPVDGSRETMIETLKSSATDSEANVLGSLQRVFQCIYQVECSLVHPLFVLFSKRSV